MLLGVYVSCSSTDSGHAWSKLNQVYGQGTMENYPGKVQQKQMNVKQLRISKTMLIWPSKYQVDGRCLVN